METYHVVLKLTLQDRGKIQYPQLYRITSFWGNVCAYIQCVYQEQTRGWSVNASATHMYRALSTSSNKACDYDDSDSESAILCITSVQAGAVLMPLAMFLLSLKSIRVLY